MDVNAIGTDYSNEVLGGDTGTVRTTFEAMLRRSQQRLRRGWALQWPSQTYAAAARQGRRPLEVLGQSTAKMSYMCVSVFSYMYASVSSGCPWWQPNSQDPGQDPPRIPGGSSTKSQDPCVSSTAKIGGSSETTSPYIILLKGMT